MGTIYCLLSAAAVGVMAIFAKLAYGAGVDEDTLLMARFGIASLVLLTFTGGRGTLRRLSRRSVLTGLCLGGVGYALQASSYFAALTKVDAAQVALVFGSYPLLVMVAAVLTRRERASRRRAIALLLSWSGIALVLSGGAAGAFDPVGAGLFRRQVKDPAATAVATAASALGSCRRGSMASTSVVSNESPTRCARRPA